MPSSLFVPLLLVIVGGVGCASSSRQEPVVASAAKQTAYAASYPTELQRLQSDFTRYRQEAHTGASEFGRYPDELKKPSWELVLTMIEHADEAGKSSAYVSEQRAQQPVKTFFTEEREEIGKRVGGSAQYAAQQKGCNADVGGAANAALKEAVEKRLEKRSRSTNEAHTLLEREHVALGKENLTALEKQADTISNASYAVSVALSDIKVRLNERVTDTDQVQTTLDTSIREENEFQAKAGRTDPEKKASSDRVKTLTQSQAQLASTTAQSKELLQRIDKEISEAQKEYADALAVLKSKVKEKAKSSKK